MKKLSPCKTTSEDSDYCRTHRLASALAVSTCVVLTHEVPTEGFDPLGMRVHRASTIVFKDAAAYAARGDRGHEGYAYGLYGTPTTPTLETKLTSLEGWSLDISRFVGPGRERFSQAADHRGR